MPTSNAEFRDGADRAAHRWLAISIACLAALGLLTLALIQHVVIPFDQPLLDLAVSWSGWNVAWNDFSDLGNIPMIPTAFGFVVWLLFKKRRREALLVILLFAAATAGSEGLKALVARPRPTGPVPGIPGVVYSYPSGHAWEDVMILGMIALALWRRQRALWLRLGFVLLVAAFVTLVCIARAALDVHYPSDMLAGLLGGFGVLGLYAWWTRPGARADKPPLWGS